MTFMNDLLTKVWLGLKSLKDERGQDLLEYALLGGLIAMLILLAGAFFATGTNPVQAMMEQIGECIDFDDQGCAGPLPGL